MGQDACRAPAPNKTHYEEPPCQSDEAAAEIQGAGGKVCAPKCSQNACPTDVPAGTAAKPSCILQDSSGDRYCALVCTFGGCPAGAQCARLGFFRRICVYPDSYAASMVLILPGEETPDITV